MIRERLHSTVRDLAGWNECLNLIQEIDEIQAAAGRPTSTVWTQVAGPFNEIIAEIDYADLATYEKVTQDTMNDPQITKLLGRFSGITVEGKGYNELFMAADRAGS